MNKYYEYKNIFSGAATIDDINFLKEKCPTRDYPMIDSMLRTKPLTQNMSIIKTCDVIKTLSELKYYDDCIKYINEIKNRPSNNWNDIQTELLMKIAASKIHDTTYVELPKIDKPCPHCGKINSARLGTTYIVCGVDSQGRVPIDVDGCMNDWCFECGKRLCKNWYTHMLYNQNNRKHDDTCCREHARINRLQYPRDYCQCNRLDISGIDLPV